MNILIRADANHKIGSGHIMRCIALAKTCQDRGGSVTFLSCCESKSLRQRIMDEDFEFVRIKKSCPDPADIDMVLKKMSTISQQKSNDIWFVLDGYHFNSEYQNAIRKAGHRLLVIDDTARLDYYFADIILNQNLGADRLKYSREPNTLMMLGPQYALLRSEFLTWRGWNREIPKVATKVLVTLGGADLHNATLQVINALKRVNCPDLEVKIVAGALNQNIEILKEAVHSAPCKMSILSDVRNMAGLMAWADMAVTAGGSTCWELSFMKLPFAIIVLAENQKYLSEEAEKVGIAIRCGWYYELDPKSLEKNFFQLIHDNNCRSRMSEKAGNMVDGFGADRVLDALGVVA